MEAPPKAFISHSWSDKERFVMPLAEGLRKNGIDAWVDKWEMVPGDSMVDKVFNDGIGKCRAFIIVLSEDSLKSRFVREELNAGFIRRVNDQIKVIPIRLDGCEVPDCLRSTIWHEVPDPNDIDDTVRKIVDAVYGYKDKPPVGDPPSRIQALPAQVNGLAPAYVTVLFAACKIALESTGGSVDAQPLIDSLAALGISEPDLIKAQEVLERRGYVDVFRTIGNHLNDMEVTLSGFDIYATNEIPKYPTICGNVASELVLNGHGTNRSLATKLEQPIYLIDHILRVLENNGFVQLFEEKAGGLLIHVHCISPELEDLLKRG